MITGNRHIIGITSVKYRFLALSMAALCRQYLGCGAFRAASQETKNVVHCFDPYERRHYRCPDRG